MLAEQILELANEALLKDDCSKVSDIKKLCEEAIKSDIAINANKRAGGNAELKRYKAALSLLKETQFNMVWYDDGKQYFANNVAAFALTKHIQGLLEAPTDKESPKRFIPTDLRNYEFVELPDLAELKANVKVAKAELRVLNKGVKPNKQRKLTSIPKALYIHEGKSFNWGCNGDLLLQAIDVLGGDITFKIPTNGRFNMGILESENGLAVICAVNLEAEN